MGGVIAGLSVAVPEIIAAVAEAAAAAGGAIVGIAETAGLVEAELVEYSALETLGSTIFDLEETEIYDLDELLATETDALIGDTAATSYGTAAVESTPQLEYSLTQLGVSVIGLSVTGLLIGGSLGIVLGAVNSVPPAGSVIARVYSG